MKKLMIMAAAASMLFASSCANRTEMELQKFIDETIAEYAPLMESAALASWNGAITGSVEDFAIIAESNKKVGALLADPARFATLKAIKESGKVEDPLLVRQMDILYNMFLGKQADTELLNKIIEKESQVEQKYSSFRAVYNGREINDNEVESTLKNSTNNRELKGVWMAHKAIGDEVAADVIEIVKLRNEIAHGLGFANYHAMSLSLAGQDPAEIDAIMDEVDYLTRDAFAEVKAEMDRVFAKRYGVKESQLMPWHFQNRYFQEAPNLYSVDMDQFYIGKDQEQICIDYYESVGLDITSIMNRSDLYPKPGKNQHAFCTDIDRNGDVRILCNISETERWMETMLHEFGHGVYALGHDGVYKNSRGEEPLPFLLREAASIFTTEAIAMLFERQSKNPEWMVEYVGITPEQAAEVAEACRKQARLKQLVFSRWVQVVYRFEKAMYADPDADLNTIWWDLVEQYQLMKRPEGRNAPDWATKIHIALYPCYYHNYQLGELFASQLHYYIVKNVTRSGNYANDSYSGNKEVGRWLVDEVFSPGMRYEWNDMIERATGEKLTAKYYTEQFK